MSDRPRFYDGQPVACVWGPENFAELARSRGCPNGGTWRGQFAEKGSRYVVLATVNDPWGYGWLGVVLSEIPDVAYAQEGFVPITEEKVNEILREALRPPLELIEEWSDEIAADDC